MLEGFKGGKLIANLGHGVHHEHRPSAVLDFVEAVHDFSYVFWGDEKPEKEGSRMETDEKEEEKKEEEKKEEEKKEEENKEEEKKEE